MPRRALPCTPPGLHVLRSTAVARALVRAAAVGPGSLAVDLGAGDGAVTLPLSRSGARVLAVEREPRLVRRLLGRFAGCEQVRVVEADVRSVPLPRRPFTVVANIPFALSTPILRRLLDEDRHGCTGADLLVEWGFAKRVTHPCPRDLGTAWWAARFDLRLVRRVGAHCFTPAPSVDAAHLSVRPAAGLDRDTLLFLRTLLRAVHTTPAVSAAQVVRSVGIRRAHRLLTASGIDPPAPAGNVPVVQWRNVALAVTERCAPASGRARSAQGAVHTKCRGHKATWARVSGARPGRGTP